jgi:apolipoprotein N-acyltransferase
LSYAKLRAIEQRKWVVRSANTGTSCFIDPWGKLYQPSEWFAKTAIKQKVELRFENTWYVILGDRIILLCLLIVLGFWLWRSKPA